MTEQIGKVTLDYTFYNGQDQYSDGDIENDLLQLIMEEPDVEKILAEDDRWPVLYHFSPVRQNILEWYPFKKDASVLEIGAGCGAISGVLCRNAKHVTSVDLSKRRSLINANRNKEYDNLTIMVGNFNDVVLKEKYDYITLIGVLEYAGYYTDDEHPFEAFLKKISGYLKEDGKLLIAIENKFGLKYWAGSREDHTGKFFDGLEGYIDTDSKVRTFSKEALKKIITDAGYGKAEFYYPFPDYKFPVQIFSDEYLPREDDLNIGLDTFDNTRMMLFNENRVYANLLKEKKFEFFANSFLVECSDCGDLGKVTYAKLPDERKEQYRILTRFTREHTVEKKPLSKVCEQNHMRQMLKSQSIFSKNGMNIVEYTAENGILTCDYVHKPLLEDVILKASEERNVSEIYRLMDLLYEEILHSSEQIAWKDNILYTLDIGIEENENLYGPILKLGFLDMNFRNAFYCDGELLWFDQEWVLEAVPAKFILYHALIVLYFSYPQLGRFCSFEEVTDRYGMQDSIDAFQKFQKLFEQLALDDAQIIMENAFRVNGRADYIPNIKKLL